MRMNGFSSHTPYTELNVDRDLANFEIDNNEFDNDNLSIDLNDLNFSEGNSSFLVRAIRRLSSLFTKRKWIDDFNLEDFDSVDGFNFDNDNLVLGSSPPRRRWMSSMMLGLMVMIAGLVITFVVLVAQKKSPQMIPDNPTHTNNTMSYFKD